MTNGFDNGQSTQWFIQESDQDGYYYLINVYSGYVLDVPGGSYADNVQLIQWKFQGNDSQKRAIYDSGQKFGKEAYWIYNKHSKKLLSQLVDHDQNQILVVQRGPYSQSDSYLQLWMSPWE